MADRIRVQIVLDGANQVRQALSNIATTGGRSFGELRRSVQGVGEALSAMSRRTAVGLTAAAGAITATGAALRGIVAPSAQAAKSLSDAATSLGMTAENLAEIQFAFGRAGVRPEQAQQMLGGFARRLQEAARAEQEAHKTREDAAARSASSGRLFRIYSEQAEQIARAINQGDEAVTSALERLYRNAERESVRGQTALDRASGSTRMRDIADAVAGGADSRRAFLERQLEEARGLREQALREGARAQEDLQRASEPSAPTLRGLQRLGIAARDSAGNTRTLQDALREIANGFQRLPDGTEKVSLAIDFFGEQGARLIPVLNRGSAGLEQLAERARRLGISLGPESTRALTEYQAAADEMADTFTGLRNTIAVVVAPAITAFSNTLQGLIERNRVAIGQGLANAIERVRPIVNDLLNMLAGGTAQTDFVRGLIADWQEVRRILGIVGRFVADEIVPVFRDAVIPAVNAVREAFARVAAEWNELTGSNATGGQVAFTVVLFKIIGGFRLLGSVIGVVVAALRGGFNIIVAVISPVLSLVARLAGFFIGFGAAAGKAGGLVAGLGAAIGSLPVVIAGVIAAGLALGVALVANFEAVSDGASRAWDLIATGFEEAIALIGEAAGSVAGFLVAAFENLPAILRFAWDGITAGFRAAWNFLPAFIPQVVQTFVSGFTNGLAQLRDLFAAAFTGLRDVAIAAGREIFEFWGRQFDALVRIIDRVRSAFTRSREQTNEELQRAAERRGFASGGYVSGPGTGTSDSILARLSNGEFVVRAAAVQRYGVSLLAALNAMRLPAFAAGGLVQPLDVRIRSGLPAFADGGLVSATSSGGRPLTLVVGGETISGFSGSDAAMEVLERRLRRDARARTAAPAPWQRRNG